MIVAIAGLPCRLTPAVVLLRKSSRRRKFSRKHGPKRLLLPRPPLRKLRLRLPNRQPPRPRRLQPHRLPPLLVVLPNQRLRFWPQRELPRPALPHPRHPPPVVPRSLRPISWLPHELPKPAPRHLLPHRPQRQRLRLPPLPLRSLQQPQARNHLSPKCWQPSAAVNPQPRLERLRPHLLPR